MSSMMLMTKIIRQRFINLSCFLLLASFVGCAHNKTNEEDVVRVSLPIPDLGSAQLPAVTPYPKNSPDETAYIEGFKVGWQIIQNAGQGGLVYAPAQYIEHFDLNAAWHDGVTSGERAASKIVLGISNEK